MLNLAKATFVGDLGESKKGEGMKRVSRRLVCLTIQAAVIAVVALAAPSLASAGTGIVYTTNTQTGQSIVPGTTDTGNHCDDCTTEISIPFPVSVYGTTYTSAFVSSNGSLQFLTSNGGSSAGCSALPINGLDRSFIPYQDDLDTQTAGSGIFTAVTGSQPNRQFVIEWRTTYFQRAGNANFEVILSESSDTISAVYGATVDNGAQETSGIQASDNGPYTQFSCGESTLVSGLRVNYVPQPDVCPAGSTRVTIGDFFFNPADVTHPAGRDGLLGERRPDVAYGDLEHRRLRLRLAEPRRSLHVHVRHHR